MAESQLYRISQARTSDTSLDVIFVHGLDGHHERSWQHNADDVGSYWPRWIADAFPDATVWTLSYELASSSWIGNAIPLFDRAKNVIALLQANAIGSKPVVFIAHSFGGLLVKSVHRLAGESSNSDIKQLSRSISGVVFLATPHTGSGIVRVAKFGGFYRPTVAVEELERANPQLRELDEWFRENADPSEMAVLAFYETHDTKKMRVVDEVSGNPNLKGVMATPIDADHITICKPASRECVVYLQSSRMIEKILAGRKAPSTPPPYALLLAESIAWCVAKWQAFGVPRGIALEMARDREVGAFASDILPRPTAPLRIVLGEVGSGKSLGAARYYQQALTDAEARANAPVPVFLSTRDLSGDLARDIALKSQGLGTPRTQGARIVLDITDDSSTSMLDLLAQARTVAGAWHDTLVLIVTRPSPALNSAEEARTLSPLSESELMRLLTRIRGKALRADLLHKLSPPVKNAVHRPQFALLLSGYLAAHDTQLPRSVAELITSLVEGTLKQSRLDNLSQQAILRRLAKVVSNNMGNPIASREFAPRDIVDAVLETHIVVESNRLLSFSDSLFLHWFAAQALLDDPAIVTALCQTRERLTSWQYPLAIALAQATFDQVPTLLQPLIEADIALAVDILNLAVTSWNIPDEVPYLSVEIFGEQARLAMEGWIRGLGPLQNVVVPRRDDQRLWTLGVRIEGMTVRTSWYFGPESIEEVVALPETLTDGWFPAETVHAVYPAAWIWTWAQRQLVLFLSALVESDVLAVPNTLFGNELAWEAACLALEVSPLFAGPLPLQDIEDAARRRARDQSTASLDDKHRAALLNSTVQQARASGQTHLTPPWPNHRIPLDQLFPPGTTESQVQATVSRLSAEPWTMYTPQHFHAHVNVSYSLALDAYAEMVATWFPRIAHRMAINTLMPLDLAGTIGMPPPPGTANELSVPIIGYTLLPLDRGLGNQVGLTIGSRTQFDQANQRALKSLLARSEEIQRNGAADGRWLHVTARSHVLDVFGSRPITATATNWLRADLEALGWFRRPNTFQLAPPPNAVKMGDDGILRITPDQDDIRRNRHRMA